MLTSILKTTIPDISPRATIKWVSKACEFLILESLVIKMLKILDLLYEGALFLVCLKTKEDTQYHQIVMLIYLRAFFSFFFCVSFSGIFV